MDEKTFANIEDGVPDPEPSWVAEGPVARVARFLNKTFPKLYAALSLAPRLGLAFYWLRRLEKAGIGRRLSALSFERRRSDTVFVLGTGASINDYPPLNWDVIGTHDSIAMNFFLLHDFVPTYHVMEEVEEPRTTLLTNRYIERGDYSDVPLVLKTQLSNLSPGRVRARMDNLGALPPEILSNTYVSIDLLAAGTTVEELESSYRMLARVGLWSPKPRFTVLTKQGGSVSYIINLAVRAGYRRVVLCGVDLNHTEYFYDSRRPELTAAGLPVPVNDESGPVHSTNDPTIKTLTMHQVILAMKRSVLDPAGVELMVGSDTSALYPDLALFAWEQPELEPNTG